MGQTVTLTKDGVDYGQLRTTGDDVEDRRRLLKIAHEGGYETHPDTKYNEVEVARNPDGTMDVWLLDTKNGWEQYVSEGLRFHNNGYLSGRREHTYPGRNADDWLSGLNFHLVRFFGYRIADGIPSDWEPETTRFNLSVVPV